MPAALSLRHAIFHPQPPRQRLRHLLTLFDRMDVEEGRKP